MEAWERKNVLGQWGVREENGRERRERKILERELEGAPYRGRAVKPQRNFFQPSPESYVTSLGGPLPYMQRLRDIDDHIRAHEEQLARAHEELLGQCGGDHGVFAGRWRQVAAHWSFAEVNDLIDRHNRYFPAESRLPMDPRTGDFVRVAGQRYDRDPLDVAWVLTRFPPELALARAA